MDKWFVVATDGDRRAELVGPFRNKHDATSELELVHERMREVHPDEAGAAVFGVERGEYLRAGSKNRYLGYRVGASGWIE